ncbi:hypothetical protein PO909_016618 [Leuciscus waleckii]
MFSDILHLVSDRRLSGSSRGTLVWVKWPALSTRQMMMLQAGGLRAFILPQGGRVNSRCGPSSLNRCWFMTATASAAGLICGKPVPALFLIPLYLLKE